MLQTPEISVIIPAYNRAHVLPRAIDSVLAQTYENFELIVVDDGSTDNTKDILADYASRDSRVRFIAQENKSAPVARNAGIAASRASWIAFLDSDDMWLPSKLERQLAFADTLSPDTPACVTDFNVVTTSHVLLYQQRTSAAHDMHEVILTGQFLSLGSTMLARHSVYDTIGLYDSAFRCIDDSDWTLRYSRHFKMATLGEPLTHYYISESSLSGDKKKMLADWRKMYQKHCVRDAAIYRPAESKILRARFTKGQLETGIASHDFRAAFEAVKLCPQATLPHFFKKAAGKALRRLHEINVSLHHGSGASRPAAHEDGSPSLKHG